VGQTAVTAVRTSTSLRSGCGANATQENQSRDEAGIVHDCNVLLGARENDINATVRSWMILGSGCGVNDTKPSVQGLGWNFA